MRKLLVFLLAAAAVYTLVKLGPTDVKQRSLAAVGVTKFLKETAPRYLREKLSIPESPVAKRERLLKELSQHIGAIESELEAAAPEAGAAKPGEGRKPGGSEDLTKRIERTQELLAQSEVVIEKLKEVNPGEGLLAKAGERALDRILPVHSASREAGSAGGTVQCNPQ